MNETQNTREQPSEETGRPVWADAVYEASVKWNPEVVEEMRAAFRPYFPYIDEATPEEVMEFVVQFCFPEEEKDDAP